jgi:hypothetical protein
MRQFLIGDGDDGVVDEDEAERRRLERQERAAAKTTQKMLRRVGWATLAGC